MGGRAPAATQIRKLIPQLTCQLASRHSRTRMSSATLSELDGLFHQLQRRMVESGEWDRYDPLNVPGCFLNGLNDFTLVFRILLQLRYQLRDAGWMDSTHAQMLGASVRLWFCHWAQRRLHLPSMTEHANANGMEQPSSFRELLDETRTRTNGILSSRYPKFQNHC